MLDKLVEISRKYGSDPEFVLAGGGNTSVKINNVLYVKGSGTTLSTISEDGFVKMDRDKLKQIMEKEYPKDTNTREATVLKDMMAARLDGQENKRPSVETPLHDLFEYSYVVHTHPALVNGLLCSKNGKSKATELFGDNVVWIDLTPPGYVLSKTVKDAMDSYKARNNKSADIILLQNHGIFIAGNSPDEIDEKYDYIMNKLKKEIHNTPDLNSVEFNKELVAFISPAIRMILGGGILKFVVNNEIKKLVKNKESFYYISSAYTPDHIVYYKRSPLFVSFDDDMNKQYDNIKIGINEYNKQNGYNPQVIAIESLGAFIYGDTKKSSNIASQLFIDAVKISVYTQSFGGPLFMSEELIDFIVNWEVESYRKSVSLNTQSSKRADNKITIVTGSAQGFGLGLAEELLKQGAYVALADLNYDLAVKNSTVFNDDYGKGMSTAFKVDVSDEISVKNMIYNTVIEYGGLDIFVSNAGVLRAGALEEITLKDFEFVTKVNYNAYFICVKYASRIMKIQNQFNPNYMMDIIQINSKSGLTGSNKNFAYAGGKFGGIGLTQSFALELVEYNIKVNAICPGNLMSGPLWMDPEKGLFVQYLETGKVPGAKTVEDVKKHYDAQVPMNRGCEIIDVARALFYVIEQEYETGQAIPVTGGQNMLK